MWREAFAAARNTCWYPDAGTAFFLHKECGLRCISGPLRAEAAAHTQFPKSSCGLCSLPRPPELRLDAAAALGPDVLEPGTKQLCLVFSDGSPPPPRGSGLTHLTIQDPLSIEGLPEPGSVVLRRGFGRGSSPRGFWRSAHPSRRAQNPAQGWSPLQTITQARRNEHPLLLQAKTGQPQRGFCNRLPAPLSKAEVREAAFTAKWERRGSRAG